LFILAATSPSGAMDALYMLTKSAFPNRMMVDWSVGLAVACFCGTISRHYFGAYGFGIAQYIYLNQFGSRMIQPVFSMFKDGPLGDDVEELRLAWVHYGVFVASFYISSIWGYFWRLANEWPVYYLAAFTIVLGAGILSLFFKQTAMIDRAYQQYRLLDSRVWHWRTILLQQTWLIIYSIAKMSNAALRILFTRLRIGLRILPAAVPEQIERPYIYDKLVTPRDIRLLRLAPRPFNYIIRCRMRHYPLDQAPEYEAISYHWGDNSRTQQILLDGSWFKVMQNAYDALYNRTFMRELNGFG
jgi:hypothetical protein